MGSMLLHGVSVNLVQYMGTVESCDDLQSDSSECGAQLNRVTTPSNRVPIPCSRIASYAHCIGVNGTIAFYGMSYLWGKALYYSSGLIWQVVLNHK